MLLAVQAKWHVTKTLYQKKNKKGMKLETNITAGLKPLLRLWGFVNQSLKPPPNPHPPYIL